MLEVKKMITNLDRYKDDLKELVKLGETMQLDLSLRAMEEEGKLDDLTKEIKDKISGSFEKRYQRWYTESCSIIRQLIKQRLEEFESL